MSKKKLAVIDYGMGNLHSVASAVAHVAPELTVTVTSDRKEIANADSVIFPGVGAIRDCMAEIRRLEFDKAVKEYIDSGKPILAICVGMQALMEFSEENDGVDCLGVFKGQVKNFANNQQFQQSTERLKVPHMGWNNVQHTLDHPLWKGIENNGRFYFVHSYYVELMDSACQAGTSDYGLTFTTNIASGNVFAAQFHPEKSHTNGLKLLENFVSWDGNF